MRSPERPGRLAGETLSVGFVVLAVLAVLALVPLPYVVMRPGPATDTLGEVKGRPIITIEGTRTYPATEESGELLFTTVRVVGGPGVRVNAFDVVSGWASRQDSVVPEEQVFPPDVTEQEVQQENTAEMADSQEVAAALALRAAGRRVPERVVVASVPDAAPAAGALREGDVLLSIDGRPASGTDAVRSAVRATPAGEEVTVVVERDGRRQSVQAGTGSVGGRTVLGVTLRMSYDLPAEVRIEAGAVGGPSAGMMFTLGIYDLLTPGPLTGGNEVAGTGTVDDAGAVGPIGGIRQKLFGARDAGAGYFLAPAANCGEVVGHVPSGLRVVRVADVDGAIDAVERVAAGDVTALPRCTG
ncbi:MAG TPA: PDZ domain-containing protein [Dermatophilaceae bacterium]|nr:PDZ domain-containing protein [Dermatophilaceae bacterium]